MIAPRSRSRRRRVSPTTTWLIRAFAPGCPTLLRNWESQRQRVEADWCERLTIFFDLPDQPAFSRGLELESSAPALRLIRIGRTVIRELTAQVSAEHRTLKIEALLGSDTWGNA